VAGNVTQSLARLRPGATLGLRGPYGSHWPIEQCRGNDLVIVAGGIGLPPLRPAIDELLLHRADYGRIVLLYGARTADLLMYAGEHARWTAGGVEIHTTVDRATAGWKGNVGVVPLLVDRLAGLVPERARVFLCGPEVMMRYSVRSALQRGLAMSRIWLSLERNMQCAVALCGHCQMGPMFLCKDGPVFRYDRVESYLRVEGL
jgi:NAD(P)H-flavin reductase